MCLTIVSLLFALCLSYNLLSVPYLDMSIHSAKEWRQYILTRGVFGNALKFSHLEVPGDVDRTPMGAARIAIRDRSVRNRIRFFLMIVKPFIKRDHDEPERELLRYMDPKSDNKHEAKYFNEGCSSCGKQRRIFCWGGLKEEDAVIPYGCYDPAVGYPKFDASFPSHRRSANDTVVDFYRYGHCWDCWAEVKDSLGIKPLPPMTVGEKVRSIQEKLTDMNRTQLDESDAYLLRLIRKWGSSTKRDGTSKKSVKYFWKSFLADSRHPINSFKLNAPIERSVLEKLQEDILDAAGISSLPDPRRKHVKFDSIVNFLTNRASSKLLG